jgi:hypothetical protein
MWFTEGVGLEQQRLRPEESSVPMLWFLTIQYRSQWSVGFLPLSSVQGYATFANIPQLGHTDSGASGESGTFLIHMPQSSLKTLGVHYKRKVLKSECNPQQTAYN